MLILNFWFKGPIFATISVVFVFAFQIRSDKENFTKIKYELHGCGVDQDPTGRFAVDQNTGYVKVYTILDREEFSTYYVRTFKNCFFIKTSVKEKKV